SISSAKSCDRDACRTFMGRTPPTGGSGAELAQVMIGGQIGPAHQGGLRQRAEDGVCRPRYGLPIAREGLEARLERCDVVGEVAGARASDLLVDLWPRQESSRPRR